MDGTRFASACRPVEPPAGLDDRVLERIEGLRAETAPVRMGAAMGMRFRPAPARISRRALVGVGATALAGAGLLGFALPRMLGEGDGDAASRMAGGSRGPRDFGLQVAYADDGSSGTVFELEPTAEGLVPISVAGTYAYVRLNFSVRGDGIASLVFQIAETPVFEERFAFGGQADVAGVQFQEAKRVVAPFVREETPSFASAEEAAAWSENLTPAELRWGDGALLSDNELLIDYDDGIVSYLPAPAEDGSLVMPQNEFSVTAEQHAAGNDGVSERGNPYLLELRVPSEELYGSGDEILALLGRYDEARVDYFAWCDEHGEPISDHAVLDPEGRALRAAYRDAEGDVSGAIGELRSSSADEFIAWMKECYLLSLGCGADVLEQTVLTVEATFEDGIAAERAYRIVRVDGFEDAVADRFDAMFDYNGFTVVPGEGVFDKVGQRVSLLPEGAPLWDFVSGEPDPDAEDERLRRPLFAIEDITETWLADEV